MNLRAKPLQGYITDSAGNTVRGATVVIKEVTATSQYRVVSTTKSDSRGFFQTVEALKPGTYDIFESGVLMTRIIHTFGNGLIPAFRASSLAGAPIGTLSVYGLGGDSKPTAADINEYVFPIQIEGDDSDIKNFGHNFPVYMGSAVSVFDTANPECQIVDITGSTVSSSRFSCEYYYPNVQTVTYRYATWRQLHAVSYGNTAGVKKPFVIPLTYRNLRIEEDLPVISATSASFDVGTDTTTGSFETSSMDTDSQLALNTAIAYQSIGKGDIVRVGDGPTYYWGIICADPLASVSGYTVWIRAWSRVQAVPLVDVASATLRFYHGFSPTMENATESLSDRLTVFEDMSQSGLL